MMKVLFKKKLEDGKTLVAYETESPTEAILFWGKPPNVEGSIKTTRDKLEEKMRDFI
jgi:hypothetical protein